MFNAAHHLKSILKILAQNNPTALIEGVSFILGDRNDIALSISDDHTHLNLILKNIQPTELQEKEEIKTEEEMQTEEEIQAQDVQAEEAQAEEILTEEAKEILPVVEQTHSIEQSKRARRSRSFGKYIVQLHCITKRHT
jgi:hypothetical protein